MQQLALPGFFGFWCLVMGVFSGGIIREIERTQLQVVLPPVILEPILRPTEPVPELQMRAFTAAEAGEFLAQGDQKRVVVLWRSQCPSCERMLSKLAVMAKHVPIQAFSLDRDPRMADAMLAQYAVPVNRYRILRWDAGELASGLGKVGISLGESFTLPFVAVLSEKNQVLGQWEGERAIDSAWAVLE